MFSEWFLTTPAEVSAVIISSFITYAAILLFTRIVGLRSFSKMSASDFAMTVAVGSLFASTISGKDPALLTGLFALACLFAGQWILAVLRRRFDWTRSIVDNRPLLLMAGARIIETNMQRANVTQADLFAKLRESNVISLQQVVAVVFETTGDISVLQSPENASDIEFDTLYGVQDAEQVTDTKRGAGGAG